MNELFHPFLDPDLDVAIEFSVFVLNLSQHDHELFVQSFRN